jgi:ABC-type multidrug transport system fused ATPase/permease subunit
MADYETDPILERLLAYPDNDTDDAFVLGVMHRVRRERTRRLLILAVFGVVGAGFGLLGAWLLADPIRQLFTGWPPIATMQGVLAAIAAAAFYIWFMNDDLNLAI